jgi:hypothetical protein
MISHWLPVDFTIVVHFGQRVCILRICAPDSPFSSEQSCHNQTDPLPGTVRHLFRLTAETFDP